jgi:hypothetical protein
MYIFVFFEYSKSMALLLLWSSGVCPEAKPEA